MAEESSNETSLMGILVPEEVSPLTLYVHDQVFRYPTLIEPAELGVLESGQCAKGGQIKFWMCVWRGLSQSNVSKKTLDTFLSLGLPILRLRLIKLEIKHVPFFADAFRPS